MGSLFGFAILFFIVSAVTAQAPTRKPNEIVPQIDRICLDCICQASSNCDETSKCHNTADGGYYCGPYVISWAYWHDAGRPGNRGRPQDFEVCLNNKTCAEEAVTNYMRKYGNDCDGSGQIDCFDFALMHKLGYGACKSDSIYSSEYWGKFEICYVGDNQPQPVYDYGDDQLQERRLNRE